ncbi:hypothetical protein QVD99_008056 [Batrachochytrium dendrobatidis]|nr:hypothetical protein QVD99_008056 [Batrachochytrium dendrobatidis]
MSKSNAPPVFIRSVIYEEKNSITVTKALKERDTTERAQFVVHLTDDTCRTIEYHTFDGPVNPGKIKIVPTSFKFRLTIKATQFNINDELGYEYKKFEKWLMTQAGYEGTPLVDGKHDQDEFVKHCVAHLIIHGKRPDFTEKMSLLIKLNLRTPNTKDKEIFEFAKHNVLADIHRLRKDDEIHATTVGAKLPTTLDTYEIIQAAEHPVQYGIMHFSKIHVGNQIYVHVRVHEYSDGNLEFHAIDTSRDSAAWTKTDPLVYFDF